MCLVSEASPLKNELGKPWLLIFLLLSCEFALGQTLGKCIPEHYAEESKVLDKIPTNLRQGIFRNESKTELTFNFNPRPAMVLKSCSLDGPSLWESPGWRIKEYYPDSASLLLIEGPNFSPASVALYNLRSGSRIELGGIPKFSEDRHHFVVSMPSSAPHHQQVFDIGSCRKDQGGCQIIYSSKTSLVSPSANQPDMDIESSEVQWLGPGRVSFVQYKRPLKFKDFEKVGSRPDRFDLTVPATVNKSLCECTTDSCICKEMHLLEDKCIALKGKFTNCGDCRSVCIEEEWSSCPWGEVSIDLEAGIEEQSIEIRGFKYTTRQCPAEEIRMARQKREEIIQKEGPIEAAERVKKLAQRRKELSDKEAADAEWNKTIRENTKKYWDSNPDWAVEESKLIKQTGGRVERQDSGSKLVIRVPGRRPLVLGTPLDEERAEGAFLKAYFPATETILLQGATEPCEACEGCTPIFKLLGLKDGVVIDLPLTRGLSGYKVSTDGNYFSFGTEDMTKTEVWSCASPLMTCMKLGDFSGHIEWSGPSSFDIFGPNANNPSKLCKCSPKSCECKDYNKKNSEL